jgi:glycosyltransferase involved in cell wall biosynthesis
MVVPFYNPGAAVVVDTVGRLAATLQERGGSYRIVAVSDGSTDDSATALQAAAIPGVTVLAMPHNRGKGAALRLGFGAVSAPLVGFIDADGDLPPEQVVGLLDIAERSGADAVVGSKLHPSSVLSVQQHRRLLSALFRSLVRIAFRLDVRDTQTGVKVYRGEMLTPLVGRLAEDGFAIDVEILVAARRNGPLHIVEAPVTLVRDDPRASTISARGAIATAQGLGRIFWRDRVAMRYDRHDNPSVRPDGHDAGADVRARP